ncbi:hypothetical protein MKQ68_06730 [Chitinophaga horti]|uniref:Uncharacterized protein n=1 Tax=Chitinophaga horti TaxID=2920382 RepID=A0ABY6J531_9BACT|nr:hypothetical protein [Chitinophaga horti]UYQ94785.1 hypothetical protein MKQ68_06730 [Chitinophaga horti]
MKLLFFSLVFSVLMVALLITYIVKREQASMYRFKDLFIRLMQKFDAWQMMR